MELDHFLLIKTKRQNVLDFFPSVKFAFIYSLTRNPYQYSVVVLKGQEFQNKRHVRSVANVSHRNERIMLYKTLPRTPERDIDIRHEIDIGKATYLCKPTALI